MGYTVSSRAITRVFDQLNQLVKAEKNLEWTVDNPKEFAYRLREAINVAVSRSLKGDGEPYDSFAKLKMKYVFRERVNKVIAELRDVLPSQKITTDYGTITLPEMTDAMEVVGAMILHRGKTVTFPSFDDDLTLVTNWCSKNQYNAIIASDGLKLVPIS